MTQQGKRLIAFASWIPTDTELWDKPEVMEIHEITGVPISQVTGLLIRAWCWMSKHGHFDPDTGACVVDAPPRRLVTITHGEGSMEFWRAVQSVGWLRLEERTITIEHGDRWLSTDARKRLLDTDRKRAARTEARAKVAAASGSGPVRSLSEVCPKFVRSTSDGCPQNVRTEKSRGEEREQNHKTSRARASGGGEPAPEPQPARPSLVASPSDLQNPELAVEAGYRLSGLPRTDAHRQQILAAAARALRKGRDAPAYFATLCRGQHWDWIADQDDASTGERPGRYDRDRPPESREKPARAPAVALGGQGAGTSATGPPQGASRGSERLGLPRATRELIERCRRKLVAGESESGRVIPIRRQA